MYVLTSADGKHAYHSTNGLPIIYQSVEDIQMVGSDDWYALEVTEQEARQISNQAYLAMYGRRDGLDL